MKDQPSVESALLALLALVKNYIVPHGHVAQIVSTMYKELAVQTYTQTIRNIYFRLMRSILHSVHYRQDLLQNMDTQEFLVGFIQSLDGEKDPRNLLIAFHLTSIICKNFDVSDLAEDLFEVTACYFPITFRPPPNDPYGISPDDLKRELRLCMVSTSLFAPYAMPLLMEKLMATNVAAKKDSMETMAHAAGGYGISNFSDHLSDIWKEIRSSIEGTDADLIESAHCLLHELVRAMDTMTENFESFLSNALSDCWEKMQQIEKKNARLFAKLSVILVGGSEQSFELLSRLLLQRLFDFSRSTESFLGRRFVVETLLELMQATSSLRFLNEFPLADKQGEFVDFLVHTIQSNNVTLTVKAMALSALGQACAVEKFLDDSEVRVRRFK